MCGLSRLSEKRQCTIYSFGINDESSFEAGLLERTRYCQVWGYDFSVSNVSALVATLEPLFADARGLSLVPKSAISLDLLSVSTSSPGVWLGKTTTKPTLLCTLSSH